MSKFGIIRIKTNMDIERSIELGRKYHSESRYGAIPFSESKFLSAHQRLLNRPNSTIGVLVELKDSIVGVMAAEVGEYVLGTGFIIATNHLLYVSSDIRDTLLGGRISVRLIRIFVEWAKENGAHEVNMHVTSGIQPIRTDKFLTRVGFQPYGGNYAITLTAKSSDPHAKPK